MSTSNPQYFLRPMAIGRYFDATGARVDLPYSTLEAERSARAMLKVLSTFHFRAGQNMLITALFDEGAQLLGAERAIMHYNMVAVSADSSLFDARRVESIARQFSLAGALGISQATLEGLRSLGHDPVQLLNGMVVWARPGAYEELVDKPGIKVYRWLELGPAVAIECSAAAGAHIDRFEWLVDEEDGEVVLSSRLERCQPFEHYRTGVQAKVIHGACSCGNIDPRIIPS